MKISKSLVVLKLLKTTDLSSCLLGSVVSFSNIIRSDYCVLSIPHCTYMGGLSKCKMFALVPCQFV